MSEQQVVTFEGEVIKGWAIVEQMGHRAFPGIVTEFAAFGGQMGRVRVPGDKPGEWSMVQDFTPASLYGIRWGTEEQVREAARRARSSLSYLALPSGPSGAGLEVDVPDYRPGDDDGGAW